MKSDALEEKRLAILQRGNLFVAGVFTSVGLYSTNLPTLSEAKAVSLVKGDDLRKESHSEDLVVLGYVFDVMNGIKVDLDEVDFDFSNLSKKQIKVLKTTMKIPLGKTKSYSDIAKESGLDNAYRFVGNVMASNRFPPLIPCHRVTAKKGLGGYGAGDGLSTKLALLKAEGAFAD